MNTTIAVLIGLGIIALCLLYKVLPWIEAHAAKLRAEATATEARIKSEVIQVGHLARTWELEAQVKVAQLEAHLATLKPKAETEVKAAAAEIKDLATKA